MTQIVLLVVFLFTHPFQSDILNEVTDDKEWLKKEALDVGLPETATWEDVNSKREEMSRGFLESKAISMEQYCNGEEPEKIGAKELAYCTAYLSRLPSKGVQEILLERFRERLGGGNIGPTPKLLLHGWKEENEEFFRIGKDPILKLPSDEGWLEKD